MVFKNMFFGLVIFSTSVLLGSSATQQPVKAHSGAAVASVLAAAQTPQFAWNKIRFGRPQFGDSSMCLFELDAYYNVNEEPTVKAYNTKIPSTLWDVMKAEVEREQLPCVQNDPSVSQDAAHPCFGTSNKPCTQKVDKKMRAEDLEVFILAKR
jgi:hypothetical protein